jgi:hypothetical protein
MEAEIKRIPIIYIRRPGPREPRAAADAGTAQSCAEMLAAFEEAGLSESHREWLQGTSTVGSRGRKRAIYAQVLRGRWSMTTSLRLMGRSDRMTRTAKKSIVETSSWSTVTQ